MPLRQELPGKENHAESRKKRFAKKFSGFLEPLALQKCNAGGFFVSCVQVAAVFVLRNVKKTLFGAFWS